MSADVLPSRLFWLASAVILALLGEGCGSGSLPGAPGVGGAGGAVPQPDAGVARCPDQNPSMFLTLRPAVAHLSGTVARKSADADGREIVTIVDAAGVEHILTLQQPAPVPVAPSQEIDVRYAELRALLSYRTVEIRTGGDLVFYATAIEQPTLPPPVRLEVGDVYCSYNPPESTFTRHRLVAYDGDQAVTIDQGQQARVGTFRVYNTGVVKVPPGADDGLDTLGVTIVRDP